MNTSLLHRVQNQILIEAYIEGENWTCASNMGGRTEVGSNACDYRICKYCIFDKCWSSVMLNTFEIYWVR